MLQIIRRKCRQPDERGAALVEFALILPLLMALLLGTVTGGMAYNRKISMTNAIREGSRFGATLTPATMNTAGWSAAAEKVRTRVVDIAAGDLLPEQVCVQYILVGVGVKGQAASTSPLCTGVSPNPLTNASGCVVSVWAQRESELQAFFFTRNVDLKARALARYERTSC